MQFTDDSSLKNVSIDKIYRPKWPRLLHYTQLRMQWLLYIVQGVQNIYCGFGPVFISTNICCRLKALLE